MNNYLNKINNYLLFDLVVLFFLIIYRLLSDIDSYIFGQVLILIGIISIINLMIRNKNSDIIVIFLFFSLTYLLYMLAFYFLDIPYHYLLKYQQINYTNNILFIQIIFIRLMFIGIKPKQIKIFSKMFKKRNNNIIYILILSLLLVMIPISLITSPPNLSANYTGEITSSIWLEYCIIFIIIGSVYSNTKFKNYLLIAVSSSYLLLPLLYGRRLQFIMVALTLFILYFTGKWKVKYILFFVIFAFIALRVFASIRMGVDMSVLNSILSVDEKGIMGNNQGGVFVCSVTYWGLIEEGLFDLLFRLKSFIGLFTGIFLPSSVNLEEAYINFSALKYAPIPGNGGFPSIYLFIWGGYIGLTIGSLIFNYLLRNPNNSRLIFIYMIFVFATFPRWHSYNMFILLKMGFWLMFFLALTDTFHKYSRGQRLNK